MDTNHLLRLLTQAQEVKVTNEGKLVDKNSGEDGTFVKPNTWA